MKDSTVVVPTATAAAAAAAGCCCCLAAGSAWAMRQHLWRQLPRHPLLLLLLLLMLLLLLVALHWDAFGARRLVVAMVDSGSHHGNGLVHILQMFRIRRPSSRSSKRGRGRFSGVDPHRRPQKGARARVHAIVAHRFVDQSDEVRTTSHLQKQRLVQFAEDPDRLQASHCTTSRDDDDAGGGGPAVSQSGYCQVSYCCW
jgi:hypothetical protein